MAALDVTFSSNVIHNYEFTWTIDNFTNAPDNLRSSAFYNSVATNPVFLDFFRENLCIDLQLMHSLYFNGKHYFSLKVILIDLNDKEDSDLIVVSSCTSLLNTNSKIIKQSTISNSGFRRKLDLLCYNYDFSNCSQISELSRLMNLQNDVLIVKCKLSISSNEITTSSLLAHEELSNCLKTIYKSGSYSDVTFSIGEKTLPAHKNIISSRSPVFAKMFENDMAESSSNRVIIEDTNFDVFDCFLMYLYTGTVDNKNNETVLALYALAHKYQVKSLHAVCSGMLRIGLATDSVCRALVLSDLHGDKDLNNVAKEFIRNRLSQIAGTSEWVDIVLSKPQLVNEILPTVSAETAKE